MKIFPTFYHAFLKYLTKSHTKLSVLLFILIKLLICYKNPLDLVGHSINILKEFGQLSRKIPVFPTTINQSSKDIKEVLLPGLSESKHFPFNIDSNFHIDLCDTARDLLQTYFKHMSIEGLHQSWKAFAADYKTSKLEIQFGLDRRFFRNDYCYILVRVYKPQDNKMLVTLPKVENLSDFIIYGNKTSVKNFINLYGTHLIHTITTGDILYQVFVYNRDRYIFIKNRFSESDQKNINWRQFFTPDFTSAIGKICLLSNSPQLEIITSKLTVPIFLSELISYQNIFYLTEELDLLSILEKLPGNSIIGLHMIEISQVILQDSKKEWFQNVLHNLLHLYELNA